MACKLLKSLCTNVNNRIYNCIYVPSRNGHHIRGKPPEEARSIEQRLKEMRYKDPELYYRVDIGFPPPRCSRSAQVRERLDIVQSNRRNVELEVKSRTQQLLLDLEEVRNEWVKTSGPNCIRGVADHYGVFQDLFGDAFFFPRVPLNVLYSVSDHQLPVCYGNIIKPNKALEVPEVNYEADEESLWTLILTNPDGHFTETESEYIHWFIGNIPGSSIGKGETIVDYLQPFPAKGTGLHRYIFILYKQEEKIDYTSFKKSSPCYNLSERTFKTLDFYRNYQELITPAGLAFFQSDWDDSLYEFYHKKLNMKVPTFEYDFPKPYIRPQEWFPKRKPFNIYMDKYRDPKQMNKEFLMRKLKHVHPFKPPPKPLPYPNAIPYDTYYPSWLKLEREKSKLKWGRINDIE
ncbi:hypothetical protein FQA39_LY05761 [Lamprigera yunnana]|nr:hypothetical protein FQA39_LY05761 [Lamprigera yunnana]